MNSCCLKRLYKSHVIELMLEKSKEASLYLDFDYLLWNYRGSRDNLGLLNKRAQPTIKAGGQVICPIIICPIIICSIIICSIIICPNNYLSKYFCPNDYLSKLLNGPIDYLSKARQKISVLLKLSTISR